MIGYTEMIIILLAALFLFGPDKIPEIAQSLGKATGEFKKAQIEAQNNVDVSIDEKDIKIHNLAREMGINVYNKSTEQLVEEIKLKIKEKDEIKKIGESVSK